MCKSNYHNRSWLMGSYFTPDEAPQKITTPVIRTMMFPCKAKRHTHPLWPQFVKPVVGPSPSKSRIVEAEQGPASAPNLPRKQILLTPMKMTRTSVSPKTLLNPPSPTLPPNPRVSQQLIRMSPLPRLDGKSTAQTPPRVAPTRPSQVSPSWKSPI
jgi:hypothetical protein